MIFWSSEHYERSSESTRILRWFVSLRLKGWDPAAGGHGEKEKKELILFVWGTGVD